MWNEVKERWKERSWIRRYLCLVLVAVLVTTQCTQSMGVKLVIAQTICSEHEEHDETCSYVKAVEGQLCNHTCDETCEILKLNCTHSHDESCSYAEAVEGQNCNHSHGDDCGFSQEAGEDSCTHTHDGTCGYVAAVEAVDCNHEHTEDECYEYVENHHTHNAECGYVEAVEGVDCNHTCPECTPAEEATLSEEVIDENTENADAEVIDETLTPETEEVESGVSAQGCEHEHDGECGYIEGAEDAVCSHTCPECNPAGNLSLTEAVFDKDTESEDYKDIEVTFSKGADTLARVERKNGTETESDTETENEIETAREVMDYVLSEDGEMVTLQKETLAQLEEGGHTIYLVMESGAELSFRLTVTNLQQGEEEASAVVWAGARAVEDVKINEANFPDAAFREYLKSNVSGGSDGVFTAAELQRITSMNISSSAADITDLTGIKCFTSLTGLNVSRCTSLTSLDVSDMTALTSLNVSQSILMTVYNAPLTSLDVSGCTALESLAIGELYESLENFDCSNSGLTSLSITKGGVVQGLLLLLLHFA